MLGLIQFKEEKVPAGAQSSALRTAGHRPPTAICRGISTGVATSMAFYSLPFWISEKTGASGTALATWESFFFAAYLFFVLFALFFIDRFPRKTMMLSYDFLLLTATGVLLILESSGALQVWHLYLNAIVQGVGYAFRLPSYSSVITIMVPRKQYVRANGMLSLLYATPEIFGPVLAGWLYLSLGLKGILAINILSFVFSIGALLFVTIPPTPHTDEGDLSHTGFFKEALYGIRYILRRPGFLGIQMVFFLGNIFVRHCPVGHRVVYHDHAPDWRKC